MPCFFADYFKYFFANMVANVDCDNLNYKKDLDHTGSNSYLDEKTLTARISTKILFVQRPSLVKYPLFSVGLNLVYVANVLFWISLNFIDAF